MFYKSDVFIGVSFIVEQELKVKHETHNSNQNWTFPLGTKMNLTSISYGKQKYTGAAMSRIIELYDHSEITFYYSTKD